jgi:hypothetical protein
VRLLRLTDFNGLEEFPAVSPDGKFVAFTAEADGTRQIWVRQLAGGPALPVTHDAADHLYPRWSSDSASLIYYSPSSEAEGRGAIWEISMFGGAPRRIVSSIGSADLSRDGQRLAFIRFNDGQMELAVVARDGSEARVVTRLAPNLRPRQGRGWKPLPQKPAARAAPNISCAAGASKRQSSDASNAARRHARVARTQFSRGPNPLPPRTRTLASFVRPF